MPFISHADKTSQFKKRVGYAEQNTLKLDSFESLTGDAADLISTLLKTVQLQAVKRIELKA